jgi:hypothetical protein
MYIKIFGLAFNSENANKLFAGFVVSIPTPSPEVGRNVLVLPP